MLRSSIENRSLFNYPPPPLPPHTHNLKFGFGKKKTAAAALAAGEAGAAGAKAKASKVKKLSTLQEFAFLHQRHSAAVEAVKAGVHHNGAVHWQRQVRGRQTRRWVERMVKARQTKAALDLQRVWRGGRSIGILVIITGYGNTYEC